MGINTGKVNEHINVSTITRRLIKFYIFRIKYLLTVGILLLVGQYKSVNGYPQAAKATALASADAVRCVSIYSFREHYSLI